MEATVSKKERFRRIGGRRVQQAIDKIELVSNCSNRNNYEYTEEDVKKMFSAINDAVRQAKAKYTEELNKMNKKKFQF